MFAHVALNGAATAHSMEVVINLIQVGRRLVVSTNVQYYSIPPPFTSFEGCSRQTNYEPNKLYEEWVKPKGVGHYLMWGHKQNFSFCLMIPNRCHEGGGRGERGERKIKLPIGIPLFKTPCPFSISVAFSQDLL